MLIHVVKSGQTLWGIAAYYGVPVSQIIDVNELSSPNDLVPGEALVIPAGNTYVIKAGDTLWGIALMYGVSLQDLIRTNGISNPGQIYPGAVIKIPPKARPVIEVNGYIYQLGQPGVPFIRENGDSLTYMSPFAYRIKEDGSLEIIDDSPLISAAYERRAVPMMAVTNFTATELGGNLAHIVLSNPSIRNTTITNIINTMKSKGYRGVNIDFENVLPSDRENYNTFLQEAAGRMHPQGFFVSTALAPKTSAEQRGPLYEAHDYPAHGRIVDFVVLMTYEWGYRLGPPQAISPLNEIRNVLDYAVSVIPRNKIFFGFQLYARDWLLPHVAGQQAETFSPKEAVERAVKFGAPIGYDYIAQSPFYRYTDSQGRRHEVWFEDARSAQAKFDTVKAYNLRGISYWALGYPFPQNWALLQDNFTIKKLL